MFVVFVVGMMFGVGMFVLLFVLCDVGFVLSMVVIVVCWVFFVVIGLCVLEVNFGMMCEFGRGGGVSVNVMC